MGPILAGSLRKQWPRLPSRFDLRARWRTRPTLVVLDGVPELFKERIEVPFRRWLETLPEGAPAILKVPGGKTLLVPLRVIGANSFVSGIASRADWADRPGRWGRNADWLRQSLQASDAAGRRATLRQIGMAFEGLDPTPPPSPMPDSLGPSSAMVTAVTERGMALGRQLAAGWLAMLPQMPTPVWHRRWRAHAWQICLATAMPERTRKKREAALMADLAAELNRLAVLAESLHQMSDDLPPRQVGASQPRSA